MNKQFKRGDRVYCEMPGMQGVLPTVVLGKQYGGDDEFDAIWRVKLPSGFYYAKDSQLHRATYQFQPGLEVRVT